MFVNRLSKVKGLITFSINFETLTSVMDEITTKMLTQIQLKPLYSGLLIDKHCALHSDTLWSRRY